MKRHLRSLLALALVLGFILLPVVPASAGSRIADDETLLEELAQMRKLNAVGFQLSLRKSYFKELSKNDLEGLSWLFISAGMTDYRLRYTEDGDLTLDDVQWSEPHTATCATEEDFREALRDMLSREVSACQIIVTDKAVFDRLAGGERAYTYSAMYGAEKVDIRTTRRAPYAFYFNNIQYYDVPWYSVSGEEAWLAAAREKAEENAEGFYLVPDPAFSEKLSADMNILTRLEAAAVGFEYLYTYMDNTLIQVRISPRYPGARIMNAERSGQYLNLTHREREVYPVAQDLADACRRDDPAETARLIHDALCERIVYTDDDETEEDDTAIGALLDGRANCDGYADAFYLTGSLAGLEVRYQHGNSRRKEADEQWSDVSHMWNLVRIDGSWRMVDVTWDDQESGTVWTWFNIGADRARRTHVWDEEHSPQLLEKTDLAGRPGNEYLITDADGISAAAADADAQGYSLFTLVMDDGCPLDQNDVLDSLSRALNRSFSYSWNEYMRCMTVTY